MSSPTYSLTHLFPTPVFVLTLIASPPADSLPLETLSTILSLLAFDYPSLLSAALVSHTWNACTTPVLYSDIRKRWDSRMNGLIRTLDARPERFALVRSIDIEY